MLHIHYFTNFYNSEVMIMHFTLMNFYIIVFNQSYCKICLIVLCKYFNNMKGKNISMYVTCK